MTTHDSAQSSTEGRNPASRPDAFACGPACDCAPGAMQAMWEAMAARNGASGMGFPTPSSTDPDTSPSAGPSSAGETEGSPRK